MCRLLFLSFLISLFLTTEQPAMADQSPHWEGVITVTSVLEQELLLGSWCVEKREDRIEVRLQEGKRVQVGRDDTVYRVDFIDTGSTLTTRVKGNCTHPNPICDCKEGLGNCRQNIRSATIQGTGRGLINLSGNIQYGSEDDRFPDGMFTLGAPLSATRITSGVRQVDVERCYDLQQVTWPFTGAPFFSIGGNPLARGVPLVDKQTRSLASGASNGSYSYTAQHGKEGQSQVTVRWSLHRKVNIECELQEVEKSWRPRHILYDSQATPSLVTAKIVTPEGETGIFRFTLFDVSKELGAALNYGDEYTEDLNFALDRNNTPQKDFTQAAETAGGLTVETTIEKNAATVQVAAWDSGGWGRIKTEVDVRGMLVTCAPKNNTVTYVNIPRDDNDNHIADSWEEDNGVSGQGAEEDQDEKPRGRENGDGLSNYEEYRGFYISNDNKWISTDPKIKDIFINDAIGIGVGPFANTSLAIHLINAQQYNGNNSRLINLNTGYAAARPVKGQHGLWLHDCELDEGTFGMTRPYIGSPNFVEEVCVDTNQTNSLSGLLQIIGHELGHAVGLHHPGPSWKKVFSCDGISGNERTLRPQNGITSGDVNNIMRYAHGLWFEGRDGKCYKYPDYDESGNQFVDSTRGTGINGGAERVDSAGRPLPLTGDAGWEETTLSHMTLLEESAVEHVLSP